MPLKRKSLLGKIKDRMTGQKPAPVWQVPNATEATSHKPVVIRDYFTRQLPTQLAALREGQLTSIPLIFCVFVEQNGTAKQEAAQALYRSLAQLRFDEMIMLDRMMREKSSLEWFIDWHSYQIDDFFTPNMDADGRWAIIILASFSPNGYIRERALHMMANHEQALPYITLRLNDWVPQVRLAAVAAFKCRLAHLSDGELLSALPYVEKITRGFRYVEEGLPLLVMDTLRSDAHYAKLLSGLKSKALGTRRFCIRALFEAATPNIPLALSHLQHEPEPSLRELIFREILNAGIDAREVAIALLRDKYPPTRMLALAYLRTIKDKTLQDAAMEFMLDKNANVRALARIIIKETVPGFDFRAFYMGKLDDGSAQSIMGLGETGVTEDTSLLAPYLGSERSHVACAAMIAIMRLDSRQYAATVTNMLRDTRPSIVKTAKRLILKYHVHDFATIHTIFRESPIESTKLKCLQLLHKAPNKWNRLLYMLDGLSDKNDDIRLTALIFIDHWLQHYNDTYTVPTQDQRERIVILLALHNTKLAPKTVQVIGFLLK